MSNPPINVNVQANVTPKFPQPFPPPEGYKADMTVFPKLDKRLVTDNEYWKTPLQADLAIHSDSIKRQVESVQRQLNSLSAALDLKLNVKSGDIQALVTRIQEELKQSSPVSLFNKDTRVKSEHVRAYMEKFFDEVRKIMSGQKDDFNLNFKADFGALEEQFLRFKAKLNLNLPVEVDLEGISEQFTKVVDGLRDEIINTLPDAIKAAFKEFISSSPQTTPNNTPIANVPGTPSGSPGTPPTVVNIDAAAFAAALKNTVLDVNVLKFLTKVDVGAGWDAMGGGGRSESSDFAYDDLEPWIRSFLMGGTDMVTQLEILTACIRKTEPSFAKLVDGTELSAGALNDVFKALANKDLDNLTAKDTKAVEAIMSRHNVGGADPDAYRDALIDALKRLKPETVQRDRESASILTRFQEIVKIFGESGSNAKRLQETAADTNTDDPMLREILQKITDSTNATLMMQTALSSSGLKAVAGQVESQDEYVKRKQIETGKTTKEDAGDFAEEWKVKMEQLLKDLAPHVQNAQKTNNEIGVLMDDITDPNRWKGLSSALDGVFDKAQKGVRDFSGVLSNMGMGDAANALNGVSSQISGGLENMRKMQEFSKQLGGWSDTLHKQSSHYKTNTALASQKSAEATRFTEKATQAQKFADRASSMGDTTSAARYTALAAQHTASAKAANDAAASATNLAGKTTGLSRVLGSAGAVASRLAIPVAAASFVIKELAFAMDGLYTASKKLLTAEQRRLQESSDLRILTRANTAALAKADVQRSGDTNSQEWDKTSDLFSKRAQLLGMEVAATEDLIRLEMERVRAVNAVKSATEALSNKQAENVKSLENHFNERNRAGTWEIKSNLFQSNVTNDAGHRQSQIKTGNIAATTGIAGGVGMIAIPHMGTISDFVRHPFSAKKRKIRQRARRIRAARSSTAGRSLLSRAGSLGRGALNVGRSGLGMAGRGIAAVGTGTVAAALAAVYGVASAADSTRAVMTGGKTSDWNVAGRAGGSIGDKIGEIWWNLTASKESKEIERKSKELQAKEASLAKQEQDKGGAGAPSTSVMPDRIKPQMTVGAFLDQGWGNAQKQQIVQGMNAQALRENKELAEAIKANYEELDAPVTQFKTELQSFGQYLPKDELEAFTKTLEEATDANFLLARSQAEVERFENILGMNFDDLDKNYARKVSSWRGGESIVGYSAQVGNETIVAKTREEFIELLTQAKDDWGIILTANKMLADNQKAAVEIEANRAKNLAQLEKAVHDARIQGLNATKELYSELGRIITDTSQGYKGMASNITSARIKAETTERVAEVTTQNNQIHADAMKGHSDEQQKLADMLKWGKDREKQESLNAAIAKTQNDLEYATEAEKGDLLKALKELTEQRLANQYSEGDIEGQQKKVDDAQRKGEIESFEATAANRRRIKEIEFEQDLKNTRQRRVEEMEDRRRNFAIDEGDKRMRDDVEYHKKALDSENSLHSTRMRNAEEYAKSRMQAAEQYATKAMETFASGRGTNPLEEAKKMTLAVEDYGNEEQKAQRRMQQENKIAQMRASQEMEIAQLQMRTQAEIRQVEFEHEQKLAEWRAQKDEELMGRRFKEEMEHQDEMFEYQLELQKRARDIQKEKPSLSDDDALLAARKEIERPKVEVREAPDMPDLEGTRNKTQNVLESSNQRMADAQRRHADALHSQAMQNADTEHKHSLAYMIERAKKERELNKEIYLDKFRAQQIELQTSAESSQRSTDTEFAKSVFSAKSGTERMQAAAQYQFDTQHNAQKTQLEQKHAAQTEEQEKQGATEEQKARLKQQQAREMGELDQTKSFRDAIVGALGGTGSLRDVAREQGIGQKSGLMEAHERIKASAFGHIKDPVADAVKNMEREQTMQHVQLMNFLVQTAPSMISAMQRQGNAMTVQTYNNTYQNGFLT